jgi:hypothetical protein
VTKRETDETWEERKEKTVICFVEPWWMLDDHTIVPSPKWLLACVCFDILIVLLQLKEDNGFARPCKFVRSMVRESIVG